MFKIKNFARVGLWVLPPLVDFLLKWWIQTNYRVSLLNEFGSKCLQIWILLPLILPLFRLVHPHLQFRRGFAIRCSDSDRTFQAPPEPKVWLRYWLQWYPTFNGTTASERTGYHQSLEKSDKIKNPKNPKYLPKIN